MHIEIRREDCAEFCSLREYECAVSGGVPKDELPPIPEGRSGFLEAV